jgi:DNA-binding MarR family transcriptional regulator
MTAPRFGDRRLADALEQLARVLRTVHWDAAYALGLSTVQLSALQILAEAPAQRRHVGSLARELQLTAPTVSDAVSALRRKGLVTPRGPAGRRSPLEITAEGRARVAAATDWDAPLTRSLESLAPARRDDALVAVLDIIGSLQRAGVITEARMCTTCRHFDRSRLVPHCRLLDAPLPPTALRVDCPDHQPAA